MYRGSVDVLDRQPMLPGTGQGEWFTPPNLFKEFEDKYGPFTLDVAADETNAKCEKYYDVAQDGRKQPWFGRVWCNPPYKNLIEWVTLADKFTVSGEAEIVVCCLPAQTSTEWWHEYAWRRYLDGTADLHWVRGKRRFGAMKGTAFLGTVGIAFYSAAELERLEGIKQGKVTLKEGEVRFCVVGNPYCGSCEFGKCTEADVK